MQRPRLVAAIAASVVGVPATLAQPSTLQVRLNDVVWTSSIASPTNPSGLAIGMTGQITFTRQAPAGTSAGTTVQLASLGSGPQPAATPATPVLNLNGSVFLTAGIVTGGQLAVSMPSLSTPSRTLNFFFEPGRGALLPDGLGGFTLGFGAQQAAFWGLSSALPFAGYPVACFYGGPSANGPFTTGTGQAARLGVAAPTQGFTTASITLFLQPRCYANCDCSNAGIGAAALSPADFTCFLDKFRSNDPYANCDGSTTTPALSPNDFTCFLDKFRAGCS
jgi:hypothetical protein